VGKETLHTYLGYLEDTFLLRGITINTDSERRRRVNPRKVYPIDTGLIPIFDRSGKANIGHALETAVFLELDRRGAEVTYIRTNNGFEVDFHARHVDGREELIQVCASIDQPATLTREVRALQDAAPDFPRAALVLVTLDQPAVLDIPQNVTVMAARDWLLKGNALK
jgi:predicted AAA+ superfamily ATPase